MGVWVRLAVQSILHSDQKDQVAYLTYCLSPPPPNCFKEKELVLCVFNTQLKSFNKRPLQFYLCVLVMKYS